MHQDRRGYYYKTSRSGGRVRREYLGRSQCWALMVDMDVGHAEEKRVEREAARAALDKLEAQVLEVEEPAAQVWGMVEGVLRATLEEAGYHLHARSTWRKRRSSHSAKEQIEMATKTKTTAKKSAALAREPALQAVPLSEQDIAQVIHAANSSENSPETQAAIKELFEPLAHKPGRLRLVDAIADVAERAQSKLIKTLGTKPLDIECFQRKIEEMKAELGGPCPSPLERLLVERIINSWLQVHQLEALLNIQDVDARGACEYLDKRLDQAHARYLAAIKSLAQVRKMQLPTLQMQVNVAQQQIVAGASSAVST